jgi:hypothetical protein
MAVGCNNAPAGGSPLERDAGTGPRQHPKPLLPKDVMTVARARPGPSFRVDLAALPGGEEQTKVREHGVSLLFVESVEPIDAQ